MLIPQGRIPQIARVAHRQLSRALRDDAVSPVLAELVLGIGVDDQELIRVVEVPVNRPCSSSAMTERQAAS
ncbi:hypothetical protein MCOR25_000089 [Pyricularia grisea]|nr:hypothetical protein MCOR25_000089 [Pyricularia grisea]